jgi:hypothetical protein
LNQEQQEKLDELIGQMDSADETRPPLEKEGDWDDKVQSMYGPIKLNKDTYYGVLWKDNSFTLEPISTVNKGLQSRVCLFAHFQPLSS